MIRQLAAAVALVLTVTSCGGDSEPAATFTPEELEGALLTPEDFGDDWIADMSGVFTSREEGPPIFDPASWCPDALAEVDGLAELNDIAATTGAESDISQTRKERRSFSGVSQQLWSNDQADRFVDVVKNAMKHCDGQSWNPSGEEADEVSIEYLDGRKLGDNSGSGIIIAVTPGPDDQYVWKSRAVAVRIGSVVMVLRELDVQVEGSDPFYSDEMWDDLVDLALAKVRAVTG
ncbi:MAG: hypothetical protein ACKOBT_14120 [Actinomycetota bacterium]